MLTMSTLNRKKAAIILTAMVVAPLLLLILIENLDWVLAALICLYLPQCYFN